ncbi:MAG: hypothetical protein QXG91_03100 [Candidatus Aenigmatarchaeota archaeon]
MKIIKEELITNVEALDIVKKSSGEKYYKRLSAENLEKFYKDIDVKKIKNLKEELTSLGFLRKEQIISLINVLPEDKNDILLVLGKEVKNFTEEQIEKIFEIIKKYI